jgi:hypothetical protein
MTESKSVELIKDNAYSAIVTDDSLTCNYGEAKRIIEDLESHVDRLIGELEEEIAIGHLKGRNPWISVDERLPDDYVNVLVRSTDTSQPVCVSQYHVANGPYPSYWDYPAWSGPGHALQGVFCWMPIPPLPDTDQ